MDTSHSHSRPIHQYLRRFCFFFFWVLAYNVFKGDILNDFFIAPREKINKKDASRWYSICFKQYGGNGRLTACHTNANTQNFGNTQQQKKNIS